MSRVPGGLSEGAKMRSARRALVVVIARERGDDDDEGAASGTHLGSFGEPPWYARHSMSATCTTRTPSAPLVTNADASAPLEGRCNRSRSGRKENVSVAASPR